MTAPVPGRGGPVPSADFDAARLVAEVDALLSSPVDGADEVALLEEAHRLISDALEGH